MRACARARPGEGPAIAALWRELWDAHQGWGGYPGSRDEAVYARLANRLNEDARVRAGRPLLGSHVHLVAEVEGAPCGQVEGWLERRGPGALAPVLCEVRSLVVTGRARGLGVGRALLDVLGQAAAGARARRPLRARGRGPRAQPGARFYARVGFAPVAWSACDRSRRRRARCGRTELGCARRTRSAERPTPRRSRRSRASSRTGGAAAGDLRFEPPRAIDAAILSAIAAHLAADAREQGDAATIVAVDRWGAVRGAASVIVQTLDPPFIAVRRSLVGRFALDPACPTARAPGSARRAGMPLRRGARRSPRRTDRISRPRGPICTRLRSRLARARGRTWSSGPRRFLARGRHTVRLPGMSFFVRAAAPLALALAVGGITSPALAQAAPPPRAARRARADPRAGAGVDRGGEAPLGGVRRRRRSREPERRPDRRDGARREGRPALALLRPQRPRRAHRARHGVGRRLHGRRRDPHEQPRRRGGAHDQRPPARRSVPAGAPRRARSGDRPRGGQGRRDGPRARRSSPTRTPRASANGSSRSALRSASATPSPRACSPRRDAAGSE